MKNFSLQVSNSFRSTVFILLVCLGFSLAGIAQNVGINSTGAAPNAAAGLDVDFPNMGLLIPRVALTGTANFAPLTAHVAGMIVYNTAKVADVAPGFYYNDGTKWIAGLPAGNAIGDMLYWNGTAWVLLPAGAPGQYLQVSATNIPAWGGAAFATITTTAASAITGITATSGGNITSDGGSAVLARGVCWNTTPGPTIANSKTVDGSGLGTFTSNLTGLLPVTTYYVKAYSTNALATTYGNEISFTTLPVIPTLAATTAATSITGTSAVTGGNVTGTGGAPILERGVCYGTAANPTTANSKVVDPAPGTGIFISTITGLTGFTTYHVRAYATNSAGTAYGTDVSFTTLAILPTLTTVAASNIGGATALSGGTATFNGGGFSNYQAYGVCYATTPGSLTPTYINTNSNNYPYSTPINPWVTTLTGLTANTTYYIRSFLNIYPNGGPWKYVYGPELTFTTTGPTAPIVGSTNAVTAINDRSGTSGGTITSDGGTPITAKGVCWSTSPNPTLGVNNFTNDGTGTASFASSITGLTGNTTYYVRAYATNSIGTTYGPADVTFTTWMTAPYTLGQDLGYGWCAYVDPTGHGFIVSYDIPSTVGWGCPGVTIGTSAALGSGLANTNLILAACATRPIAASVASTYNGGGFTDWYLPSSGEWALIAANYSLFGLAGHGYNNYYTSTEVANKNYAGTYFATGSQAYSSSAQRTPGVNDYIAFLRVIRSF